jgi:hypothetical protein
MAGRVAHPCTSNGALTVTDANGFHELDVIFSGCENSATLDIQILSAQLFAASVMLFGRQSLPWAAAAVREWQAWPPPTWAHVYAIIRQIYGPRLWF